MTTTTTEFFGSVYIKGVDILNAIELLQTQVSTLQGTSLYTQIDSPSQTGVYTLLPNDNVAKIFELNYNTSLMSIKREEPFKINIFSKHI